MSASRFVPSGTTDQPHESNEAWARAQEAVEASKVERTEPGRQEGGKSLYEVLQQNKAAKQEAFEESIKLKNQFRALEEDEVEFLDSVAQAEREKSDAVQKETSRQLEAFKKQQQLTAGGSSESEFQLRSNLPLPSAQRQWLGVKKRKRQGANNEAKSVKLRKPSTTPSDLDPAITKTSERHEVSSPTGPVQRPKSSETAGQVSASSSSSVGDKIETTSCTSNVLGLGVYADSDED